ncbi:DddA-like double-stranded DNA deaminase toxin [Kribbella sp. NPDC050124]|uniref:DddA-like double-stranded DNA deaminase toxin n=1 Tax=Kribbella sp. NPDC050124 TaxID=3364114 RepID=UPI003798787E
MPSELQRVAEQLLACLNEAPRAVGYLHDRARKCREAAAWIGSTSNNPSAHMAAMQLDDAARRCEEAAHYITLAEARAKHWVEQMVSGVRTAEPSDGSTGERPLGRGGNTRRAERRQDDKPEAGRPDKPAVAGDETSPPDELPAPRLSEDEVRRILDRLPVRKPGDKTRGVWRDDDGIEHDLVSGRHEDDFDAAQRHAERLGIVRKPHGITTAADVELKFAMRMRREGIRHAEIILNNKPCEGQLSCDELLDRFLPDGASLTVYGPNNFKCIYPKRRQQD